jgi:hypothetical protein
VFQQVLSKALAGLVEAVSLTFQLLHELQDQAIGLRGEHGRYLVGRCGHGVSLFVE